jgi:hypothetical protein
MRGLEAAYATCISLAHRRMPWVAARISTLRASLFSLSPPALGVSRMERAEGSRPCFRRSIAVGRSTGLKRVRMNMGCAYGGPTSSAAVSEMSSGIGVAMV